VHFTPKHPKQSKYLKIEKCTILSCNTSNGAVWQTMHRSADRNIENPLNNPFIPSNSPNLNSQNVQSRKKIT